MPRVSIVITARNVADQLPRCIASLSAQTFGDFEAIVVDDASKDGTSYVAQGATKRDPRFQMLQQPTARASTWAAWLASSAQAATTCFSSTAPMSSNPPCSNSSSGA